MASGPYPTSAACSDNARLHALARLHDALRHASGSVPFQSFADALGPATGASRVYVCTNHPGQDGIRLMTLRAEWCRDGAPSAAANLRDAAYAYLMPAWESMFLSGQPVAGIAAELAGPERAFCTQRDAAFVRLFPLSPDGSFAGIVGLDYPVPPTDPSEPVFLTAAVDSLTQVIRCIRAQELAQQLSIRDDLTGLHNRKYLEDSLARMDAFSKRYARPMAVLWVDLDHFKDINDSLGHSTGDHVLAEFADLLARVIRSSDVVARYGGDEFIVALPEAGPDPALLLATRILEATRAHVFCHGQKAFHLTASVGVASNEQDVQGLSFSELLANADEAMYHAKQRGRDQAVLWSIAGELPDHATGSVPSVPVPSPARDGARPRILIVDDEPSITTLLEKILRSRDCDVVTCAAAPAAIEALKQQPGAYDLLLSDIGLPGMDGLELIDAARRFDDSIVCIVITGHATTDQAVNALRRGVYDFVQKPFVIEHFHAVIQRALDHRRLVVENLQTRAHLQDLVREKSEEVLFRLDQLRSSYQFTLETMAAMLDARERGVGRHSIRVRALTVLLARHIGIPASDLEEIGRGALVHDIGKIGIPDSILNKPGPLSADEWEVMKQHPEIGYRFLENSAFLKTAAAPPATADVHVFSSFIKTAAAIVLSHHERFDGSGYPRGLKGEEIPLGARLFAVIDAYDAMRSSRVYRKPMPANHAVEEIARRAGTQFDPAIVQVFLNHRDELDQLGAYPAHP